MPVLLDFFYLLALAFLSPWLFWRFVRTGRYRRNLLKKLLGLERRPNHITGPRPVWFHGVSVGEVHLLRPLIARFQQRFPEIPLVISTTTDTGFDEALRCFPNLPVIPYPFDFSWAVRRTIELIHPALIVLAESELWPNFLATARRKRIPVAIINGRMSPRSFQRFRKMGSLARHLFRHVSLLAVQNEAYASCLRSLGVNPMRIQVTGNIKFDGVTANRANPKTQAFRNLFQLPDDALVWIVGSTQPPEEEIALDIFDRLQATYPKLRLILVPRQQDRFEEVAALIARKGVPFLRRSQIHEAIPPSAENPPRVILVDSIGELSAVWGLADIAFVGGSLDGKRGGQNMIEPAAYGAAVLFGPHVWNFREIAQRLVEVGGALRVADAAVLEAEVRRLIASPQERQLLGATAREFVLSQQGATDQAVTLLGDLLGVQASQPMRRSA